MGMHTLTAILILLTAVAQSKAQDNFFFSTHPVDQNVVEGSEVILRCDVSNRRSITFHWEMDGRMIENTSRRFQDDSDLHILRVDRNLDNKGFYCVAVNTTTGGTKASSEAFLNILWIDKTTSVELIKPRDEEDLAPNTDVVLKCETNGNLAPTVMWYKNKVRLFENNHVKFMRNKRLKLVAATSDNNGVYSCEANNDAGVAVSQGIFILTILDQGVPRLNKQTFTSKRLLPIGATAVFNCEFVGENLQEWFHGNVKLAKGRDEKYLLAANGSLIIKDVQLEDEGAYMCVGVSSNSIQSYVADLQLATLGSLSVGNFEPKLPGDGYPVVVPISGDYELKCLPPDGNPTPDVKWVDPQGQLIPAHAGPGARLYALDGTLMIRSAVRADSGNYTCMVENLAGSRRQAVWIVISEPPIILRAPEGKTVKEGSSVELYCSIRSTPYPVTRITWLKDQKPVLGTPYRIQVYEATGYLRINEVQLSDDGNYACVATTDKQEPEVSLVARLYVKKILKIYPLPQDTTLQLGDDEMIACNADGQPAPLVSWKKEGTPEGALGLHVTDYEGTLQFTRVQWEHAGNYTCTAVNGQGTKTHTIDVKVAIKPHFAVRPVNTTAAVGEAGMLHCAVKGTPQPRLEWFKVGHTRETLDPARFQTLMNGTLYITSLQLQDSGKYSCLARNIGGWISEEVFLFVGVDQPSTEEKHLTSNFDMMKTIIIAVCAAVAYLAIVIGLTVYCSIRLVRIKHAKTKRAENGKHENGSLVGERQGLMGLHDSMLDGRSDKAPSSSLRGGGGDPLYDSLLMQPTTVAGGLYSEADNRSHISGISSSQHGSHGSHQSNNSNNTVWIKYSYPRNSLQSIGMLGKGVYGDVFLAKAPHIKNGHVDTLVCVKSIQSNDQNYMFEFRREMDMYSRVHHENVIHLLGVCLEQEPHFLITEYLEWGDLKQFLWASRKENHHALQMSLPPLTTSQKVSMCHQVALGMEHLANQRLVHRDLAARNVFLSPTLHLKVGNPALCRDIYIDDYLSLNQRVLPLRWMAPEAVLDDEHSQRSDVWAFGCFALEVFSLGEVPHAGRSHDDILRTLDDPTVTSPCSGAYATRVDCPQVCWTVIQRSTMHYVKDRPSFTEICTAIGDMTVDSDI